MTDRIADSVSSTTAATEDLQINDPGNRAVKAASNADPFEKVIRAHHRARDVTSTFQQAAKSLRSGQLVKNDTFTLFEAVQALEIMDPKMDSGMLPPEETLDDDLDLGRSLVPEQVLGIMEQMLRYEMAWHQGHPLSQTLFTSLHLDHLLEQEKPPGAFPRFPGHESGGLERDPLLHLVLRAYCIGVIKNCDIAIEMVASQLFFEEEDFNVQVYDRDFLTDIPDEDAMQLLAEANVWLLEQRSSKGPNTVLDGIRDHIVARKDLIDAFLPAPTKPLPKNLFRSCTRRLDGIKEVHMLAEEVKEAFSSKMHRKLASTAPPRSPVELSFEDAVTQLERMLEDLLRTLDVVAFDGGADGLKNFLWSYSYRSPQPCAFARAFLQSLTVGEIGVAGPEGLEQLIWSDLETSSFAFGDHRIARTFWDIEVPDDIRFNVARMVDFFVERAAPEYEKLFRSLCQNRCRLRRCLVNVIRDLDKLLQDFREGGAQVGQDDAALAKDPMMASARAAVEQCVRLQMVQTMQWTAQLSIEHELLLPHELALGHWLLRHFAGETFTTYLAIATDGPNDEDSFPLRLRIEARLALEQIAFHLADGTAVIYALFHRLQLLPATGDSGLATSKLQYQLRVQPYVGLSCYEIPPYEQYQQWLEDGTEESSAVIESAAGMIDGARKSIQEVKKQHDAKLLGKTRNEREWDEALQRTEKVCVRAKLLLHTLRQGLSRYGEKGLKEHATVSIPPRDKQDSPWWALPSITIS